MKGQGGEALDVALELLRAPALRTALRARPLPGGVAEVLSIASGSSERVRLAATRTGYGETELVEAARFFVQQVLLAEGADAYRVLGADRHAQQATLRDHHRMLQRWLHPDRSPGAEWESALSTRVNQAWNQLRTQSARSAYDASYPPAPLSRGEAVGAAAAAIPYPYPPPPAVHEPVRPGLSPAPVAVGFLGLACVALTWLAVNRDDFANDGIERPSAVVRSTAPHFSEATAAATSTASPAPPGVDPSSVAIAVPAEEIAAPMVISDREAFATHTPERAIDPTVEMVTVEPLAQFTAPVPGPLPGSTAVNATDRVAAVIGPEDAPASATVSTTPTRPVDRGLYVPVEVPVVREPAPSTRPAGAVPAAATAATSPSMREPSVPAQASASVAPAAPGRPAPREEAEAVDPLQLFLEAESAVRGVTAYLAGTGAAPTWAELAVGMEAADIRSGLQSRHEGAQRTRMEIDGPDWNLGAGRALVSAPYRLAAGRRTVETGMLRVHLTRQDGQWLVRELHLKPLP